MGFLDDIDKYAATADKVTATVNKAVTTARTVYDTAKGAVSKTPLSAQPQYAQSGSLARAAVPMAQQPTIAGMPRNTVLIAGGGLALVLVLVLVMRR